MKMQLEQKELTLLFDNGLLTKAKIVPAPMDDGGYNLLFTHKSKGEIALITAREHVRVFRTLQVAINTVEKIGFKKVEVNL